MKKKTIFTGRALGIVLVAFVFGVAMWSAGWVSARIYFADKIEKEPTVVQVPPPESMLILLNEERRVEGLRGLYLDERLINAARAKACDMRERGYFDHKDPSGVMGWHFVDEQGVSWMDIGENLAKGTTNPTAVMKNLMASPSHKKNILDSKFQYVGYASCGQYTAQFFTR